ncbi:Mth938-like domain-containing protein [Hansschlegelia sp.]|uniref:Mth938-like domain-containing protein n=1 Tax=Hansschlegelia sp. TaxID=2041892 RepID=UPI002C59551C|nr:MTH938/NDUFAF3 family protein [Hansschlegelia sp.]HVI29023.1 MTH938/NDUFAF3 family protein [Hansschlegelia sp.]
MPFAEEDERHLPGRHPIDAYGGGGFRFGELSHRGSLLATPSGMWAWRCAAASEFDEAAFERVFREAEAIDTLLIGTGVDLAALKPGLRQAFRDAGLVVEVMATGAAARTWNVMIAEERRVAAALLAVP